jgi:NADH:ubiquinone oxidoreductase subunit 3 (chain A)
MQEHYGIALAFGAVAFGLMYCGFIIQKLISPKNSTEDKMNTYECGEVPEGEGWLQFNIRFYVVALIFIIFDVEVVFLFPMGSRLQGHGLSYFCRSLCLYVDSYGRSSLCLGQG